MQKEEVMNFIWKCKAGYAVSEAEVKRIAEWLESKLGHIYIERYTR